MICTTIYREGKHRWLVFGQDPERPDNVIDTNQVVVASGDSVVLLDPGGMEVFPAMLSALTERLGIEQVRHLFFSHQDPDVCSALPLWRSVCGSGLQVHASWLWTGFISHFDREAKINALPDEGGVLALNEARLQLVPAHYLHSPGNFSVYDARARILFSGDIGASLVPPKERRGLYVENFADHIRFMDGFHRRWMASEKARDAWVERVARLDLDQLVPQHGLLFRGDDVKRFLDWLAALPLGSALAEEVRPEAKTSAEHRALEAPARAARPRLAATSTAPARR